MDTARICLLAVCAFAFPWVGCAANVGGGAVDGGAVDGGGGTVDGGGNPVDGGGNPVDGGGNPVDATPPAPDANPLSQCPPLPPGGQVREWQAVMGSAWPQSTSNVFNVVSPDPGYLAMRFSTGDYVGTGRIINIENTTAAGVRYGTISKCQGDYRAEVPAVCRHAWGIGGSIRWSTQASPAATDCPLEPNTVYYLNTTFMSDPYDVGSSTCSSVLDPPVCSFTLNHSSI